MKSSLQNSSYGMLKLKRKILVQFNHHCDGKYILIWRNFFVISKVYAIVLWKNRKEKITHAHKHIKAKPKNGLTGKNLWQLRPCVRRNFSNFLFLQVSEMFGCQSSEFFWKKPEIFAKKFGKKFGNLSLEKNLDINQNCTSISKISKKLCKVWGFESKKPCFWVKKFGKSLEKFRNRVFQTFRNFLNFGNCSIQKFQKITKKWR